MECLAQGIKQNGKWQDESLYASLADAGPNCYPLPEQTMGMPKSFSSDDRWIIVDKTYPTQIAERIRLLENHPDLLIARMDGEDVARAEKELLSHAASYLLNHYEGYFEQKGKRLTCRLTGISVDFAKVTDPLKALSCLITEDMVLLLSAEKAAEGHVCYRLKSGALLFPNDWGLVTVPNDNETNTGLGKTSAEIHHGKVKHYDKNFAAGVEHWNEKLKASLYLWRRNWGPHTSKSLCLHPRVMRESSPNNPEDWDQGFIRSEQQSFVKLPKSGAIVFGIKTYIWPLSDFFNDNATWHNLKTATENLPPDMVRYREAKLSTFTNWLSKAQPQQPT